MFHKMEQQVDHVKPKGKKTLIENIVPFFFFFKKPTECPVVQPVPHVPPVLPVLAVTDHWYMFRSYNTRLLCGKSFLWGLVFNYSCFCKPFFFFFYDNNNE